MYHISFALFYKPPLGVRCEGCREWRRHVRGSSGRQVWSAGTTAGTCTDTELQVTLFLVVELEWAMKHDSAFKSKFFNTFNTTKSVQKDTVSSEVLLDKSVVPKTISCSHSQVKVKKID